MDLIQQISPLTLENSIDELRYHAALDELSEALVNAQNTQITLQFTNKFHQGNEVCT